VTGTKMTKIFQDLLASG